jgi:hypothetical protein
MAGHGSDGLSPASQAGKERLHAQIFKGANQSSQPQSRLEMQQGIAEAQLILQQKLADQEAFERDFKFQEAERAQIVAAEHQKQLELQKEKELTERLKKMREMREMRELREIQEESQSSQGSSTTQVLEDDQVKGLVDLLRADLDDTVQRVNTSLSETQVILMEALDKQSKDTNRSLNLILQRLEVHEGKDKSADQSGGFAVEPEPEQEPEDQGKSVQPQAPGNSVQPQAPGGSEEPGLNPEFGASFSGIPVGEEEDEGEKARQ